MPLCPANLIFFFFYFLFFFFLRQGLALSPRLGFGGAISVYSNLCLSGLSHPRIPASQVAGIIGARHHVWLIFVFFIEMGFRYVAQTGLKLQSSSDRPPKMLVLQA
uniref:Uncharacterized protein n=1 Tax=Macaca mulatta TaxID=9544 RepID=A0A5F8A8B0_MACMU